MIEDNEVAVEDGGGDDEGAADDELDEISDKGRSLYLPYDPDNASLLHYFRPQNDIVAQCIVNSSMEGTDRYEISAKLGINAKIKAGNRIVSSSIHSVMRNYPQFVGVFQKMEGRHRMKKYYIKSSDNAPGGRTWIEYSQRFKEVSGMDCPFKMGESMKFPGQNLNTLRISDVTLKRLVHILEYIYREKVVITRSKLESYIAAREKDEGYKFQIDRKSLKKCVLALAKFNLVNLMQLDVEGGNLSHKVDVMTVPQIDSLENVTITEALTKIQTEYKEQNKCFPAGYRLKQEPVVEEEAEKRPERVIEIGMAANGLLPAGEGPSTSQHFEVKQEPPEEEEELPEGSLLDKTFSSIQRVLFQQKYGKTAAPLSVLSQKSINSLVESAKRRNTGKGTRGTRVKKELRTADTADEVGPLAKRPRAQLHRLLDNVDRVSVQHKAYLRSKFTQRERDMLLLIRACSFFLSPVNRFWPHPLVMRNLMHEFVPESRSKTTYSLMAAGVRELKSKERFSHNQYIVKTMASYAELLEMRNKLAQMNQAQFSVPLDEETPGEKLRKKDHFFIETFRKAYQLLFRESTEFPSIHATDSQFHDYMIMNKLKFLPILSKTDTIPQRSKAPVDENEVQYGVAYNAIMSVLHTEALKEKENGAEAQRNDDEFADQQKSQDPSEESNLLIKQIDLPRLTEVMDNVRSDGLITRRRMWMMKKGEVAEDQSSNKTEAGIGANRAALQQTLDSQKDADIDTQTSLKSQQTMLTQFYRHYFESIFHKGIAKSISNLASKSAAGGSKTRETFGRREDPGEFVALVNLISRKTSHSINIVTPKSLTELFVPSKKKFGEMDVQGNPLDSGSDSLTPTLSATKQLRYLENSELRLDLVRIRPNELRKSMASLAESLPPFDQLVSDKLVPVTKMPPPLGTEEDIFIEELDKSNETVQRKKQRRIDLDNDPVLKELFKQIVRVGLKGISEEELLSKTTSLDLDSLREQLNSLTDAFEVIACGVDKLRYVSTQNARAWLMSDKAGQGFVVKPWHLPSGRTNPRILKWMLGGLFYYIYNRPGLALDELITHFAFILQPYSVSELLQILERMGCCSVRSAQVHSVRKSSPFAKFNKTETLKFVQPTLDGFERLVLFIEANDEKTAAQSLTGGETIR